jgi:hypothetical protein
MRLKLDNGIAVLQDGKPVYVKDDQTEQAVDVGELLKRIGSLNGEAKGHREAKEAAEAALQTEREKSAQLETQLHAELVGTSFARSAYIAQEFAAQGPAGVEVAEALFAKYFSVKDGKLVATDAKGARIMSAAIETIGQPAGFEEALKIMVEAYPHKATLLRGKVLGGGGASASSAVSGSRQMNRSSFQNLDAKQQAAHFAAGGTVVD